MARKENNPQQQYGNQENTNRDREPMKYGQSQDDRQKGDDLGKAGRNEKRNVEIDDADEAENLDEE